MPLRPASALVLAGGRSARFGGDKSLALDLEATGYVQYQEEMA